MPVLPSKRCLHGGNRLHPPFHSCFAVPWLLCSNQQTPLVLVLPSAFLFSPGCRRQWDNITCWPEAEVGEVVVRPCPKYFRFLTTFLGKPTQRTRITEMGLRLHCLGDVTSYRRGSISVESMGETSKGGSQAPHEQLEHPPCPSCSTMYYSSAYGCQNGSDNRDVGQ